MNGQRRPHPFAALGSFAPEDTEVVATRGGESRGEEERPAAGGQDARRNDGLAACAFDHEIRSGDCKADEHRAVEVRPERDERHEEPHAPARFPRLSAQKQQRGTEEHEGEELRAHDDEGRNGGEEHEQQDRRARGISCAERTHPECQQRQGHGHGDELPEEQASIPAHDLQRVEDELPQDRHVRPVDRRSRGVWNTHRDRALRDDRPAERSKPSGIGSDAAEQRAGARPEGDGKPGERGALRPGLHGTGIGLESRPL